jgi:hypothetical protein
VSDLDAAMTNAEQARDKAAAISREMAAVRDWEHRTRRQRPNRRDPAPKLQHTRRMTSHQRWDARADAEREAERYDERCRALLAEHGYA